MKQNIFDGFNLILKAYRGNIEDKLWQQWLSEHIYMDSDHRVSFEEYLDMALKPADKSSHLSKEEIVTKAEKIKQLDQIEGR